MPALKWTYEKLAEEALKYTTKAEFSKGNSSAYVISRRKGFLNEICSHMVCGRQKWTDSELRTEALRYNSRSEFQEGHRMMYQSACSRGIMDDICSHMNAKRIYWDLDSIHTEAKKYNSRRAFKLGSHKAYKAAHNKNIVDHVCSHMKPPVGSWKSKPIPDVKTCDDCSNKLPLSDFEKSPKGVYYVSNVCNKCNYIRIINRENSNPTYKISNAIRSLITNCFRNNNKESKTEDILGCSLSEFKSYIQEQFNEGMTWGNYGRNGWHLDHKVPISLANNVDEVYKLNHYINFQPLWELDNIYKSNKLLPEFVELKDKLLSNDTKRTSET